MMNIRRGYAPAICAALVMATGACKRNDPVAETQTVTVQPRTESENAAGCLRAGMAENTFVLTTGGMEPMQPNTEATTYQLTGHTVDLRHYVGQRVEVTGTLRSASEIASKPAPVEEQPAGTSGTPTIETKTEVNVKEMTVEAVKPLGERCADVEEK
jgi:hypothetical protein